MESSTSFLARHEFLLRRLHSLSGLIPVGVFLFMHLFTNASILGGGSLFQEMVDRIHSLGPILPAVEWVFIFIPLLFHAIFGFIIIGGGVPNTSAYPYANNIRYTLQRATGVIAFFYIVWHVMHMHWLGEPLKAYGGAQFDPHDAAATGAQAIQAAAWIQVFYAVGILSCVYHLANGIWTMGITWGVWTSANAQRRANYLCLAVGLLLAVVGLGALFGFMKYEEPASPGESPGMHAPEHGETAPSPEGDGSPEGTPPEPSETPAEDASAMRGSAGLRAESA